MRRILFVILIFCFQTFVGFGQIKFFKVFTNNGYDYGQGITQLADSSYMVTGSSSSFNEGPSQVFLMKLDSLGTYQWSKNYGGIEGDWGRRVLNWNDSIFYIAGYSFSTVSGFYNNYLLKCDKDGNQLLEKHYNHASWDKVNDAILTADSTIYMVGETTATPNNNRNFYIVKTDHNGDTLWTRNFGGPGEDMINSIKQFDDTTFYAVGEMFNVDSTLQKGALIKFFSNGEIAWTKNYGQDGAYKMNDFFIRSGNIYSVGSRIHPIDGDADEFRISIALDGTENWQGADHSEGEIELEHVVQYGNSVNVYIGWNYKTSWSVGNSQDAGITRFFDNLIYNNLFVGVGFLMEDRHCNLIATSDGGAIATGFITVEGYGGSSVFVLKIGPNDDFPVVNLSNVEDLVAIQEIVSNSSNSLVVYPNPTASNFKFKTAVVEPIKVEIVNLFGQNVWQGEVVTGTEIQTSNWESGIYFVRYTDVNSEIKTIKLILQ